MAKPQRTKAYRLLEMIPGLLTWLTLVLAVALSYLEPVWVAFFIIIFDLYWVLKAVNIGLHLTYSYRKIKVHKRYDWLQHCEQLQDVEKLIAVLQQQKMNSRGIVAEDLDDEILLLRRLSQKAREVDYKKIFHIILLPTVHESLAVLSTSIDSYLATTYPKEKMMLVLACEERSGQHVREISQAVLEKYQNKFFRLLVTVHPDGIEGEAKTKGANITHAIQQAKKIVDEMKLPYEDVIVSAFDADTVVSKNYFAQLTYTYLTTPYPTRSSYQPVPLYNNNVWDSPAFNRLAAATSSFWQMIESSRPDRLITFSSHSMSLRALVDVDYWPVDVISEDSQIFWRCFLHYHGDYRTVPLFTTVSLDAVVLDTYMASLIGQYKQYRRWAWGVVDWPYLVTGLRRDRIIPFWKKILYSSRLLEGHYFWATAALMIAFLGWLPLLLGSGRFENQVFALNLPKITGSIMTISTVFLIFSVVINFILLPQRPGHLSRARAILMFLQWFLVPVASILFGSLPAIDAQTRLLFGKYMEFWVTPKIRRVGNALEINPPLPLEK